MVSYQLTYSTSLLQSNRQRRFQTGGVWGVLPTLAGKWGGVGGVFFGKIRHNKQKLSINLTFFPFSFDQMFTSLSF